MPSDHPVYQESLYSNMNRCPQCWAPSDVSMSWCVNCGYYLIGLDALTNVTQERVTSQTDDISIGEFSHDASVFTDYFQNGMNNEALTYSNQTSTNNLLQNPSNLRHRYLSGPVNPPFGISMLQPVSNNLFQSQEQLAYPTSYGSYNSHQPMCQYIPHDWHHHQNQQSNDQMVNLRRQKFSSESAYENDLQHMRMMLNSCFANQDSSLSPSRKWTSSSREQASNLLDVQSSQHTRNSQKNRSKGRSCSRISPNQNKSPMDIHAKPFRSRPPSANNVVPSRESEHSNLTQLEADFRCCLTHSDLMPIEGFVDTSKLPLNKSWHNLPAEMWIKVASYLDYGDRSRLAITCRRMASLMQDRCLWRRISLHYRRSVTDSHFHSISNLRPRQLHLVYCKAPMATLNGISWSLRQINDSLTHLSFIGCSKGVFENDAFLLRAVDHCQNLQHIDASYSCGIRDQTVIYIAKRVRKLRSLLLNGAQSITINAIRNLVKYQCKSLERLELFGCFKLNSDIFCLLSTCFNLRILAFGHLHHLSSSGLLELVKKLPHLASLDLRGTMKLITDQDLTCLADNCPLLEEFVLANMKATLSENTVAEMLRRLQRLRVLDLCGIAAVGDLAMEVLASSCPDLQELDVSCSSVTQVGIEHLVEKAPASLQILNVSYCKLSSNEIFKILVRVCPKLTKLVAYGLDIKDWSPVFAERTKESIVQLDIETEASDVKQASLARSSASKSNQTGSNCITNSSSFRPVPLDKS